VNGVHDMGGLMNFGPVVEESDEPVFHAEWERRAFGLTMATTATGAVNVDMGRSARESIAPADYLSSSYFEIWLRGLERLVVTAGLVTADELAAGTALAPAVPVKRVLTPEMVPAMMRPGRGSERPATSAARFAVGDAVVTRNLNPTGHTRLPRYARGKRGVIDRVNGVHVFPDSNAHGGGEDPRWLYTVLFTGTELWGPDADPTLTSSIDAWESYLEPAV
jgi:nitrile hydratase beta subunit